MLMQANWHYPTEIFFGPGRVQQLPIVCEEFFIRQPLIVTDPTLAQLPFVTAILEQLTSAGLKPRIFSDIKANPTDSNIDEGVAAFEQGHHDGVIAIGGGSAMDAGKTIAFMSGQTLPLWHFEDIADNYKQANTDLIAPCITIPTTAGTGSEVGRASVIVDESDQRKVLIFHPLMLPKAVVADPELTISLPANLTAATGMDALAHCLEAFCANGFNPMADGIAMQGLRLINTYLVKAVKNGQDLEARSHCLAAAIMGGAAFQKGLGAIHSLSHPIGGRFDAHHGTLNAIFTPHVLRFNQAEIEEKMQQLSDYLQLTGRGTQAVIDWVISLMTSIAMPMRLSDVGINGEDADEIAELALADPSTAGNPVKLTVEDLKALYLAAV